MSSVECMSVKRTTHHAELALYVFWVYRPHIRYTFSSPFIFTDQKGKTCRDLNFTLNKHTVDFY